MNTDLKKNNAIFYANAFKENPFRFANELSIDMLKKYNVNNLEVWKSFIINFDKVDFIDPNKQEKEQFKNLAQMYFITIKGKKTYLIEKLPSIAKIRENDDILKLAEKLKKDGIEVDTNSAYLLSSENKVYKFMNYKITKEL